jgi:hypothetical protein
MKAELDKVELVQVSGLASRLQEPTTWKPGFLQRPWVLATDMLGPLAVGIAILLVLLIRRHISTP